MVYVLCLGAFAFLHYDGGHARPDAGGVIRDFHAYLGFGPKTAEAEVDAPTMRPMVAPPPAPAPAVVPREESPMDRVYRTLKAVEREAPSLTSMGRGPEFNAARIGLLSRLSEAREVLGSILDEDPENYRANGLWDDLQYLQAALRKY